MILFLQQTPQGGAADAQALGGGGVVAAGFGHHPQGHVLADLRQGAA